MGIEMRLLGAAVIKKDGAAVKLGGKSLALLAYLLVTGKPHSRENLMELLFDEAADPRASLRWLVSDLRRKLGKEALISDRQSVAFNFDTDHWLDLAVFEKGEVDQYRGDLLAGLHVRDARRFEDWLFYERERRLLQYEEYLISRMADLENKGDFQGVIEIAGKLLQLDNLNESWHRSLMQAYALSGNQKAAQAQYALCHDLLMAELGEAPNADTEKLLQAINSNELADPRSLAEIPVHYPPFLQKKSAERPPPVFVGRKQPLNRLAQMLRTAVAGQGQVAFVQGGAGRGKTAIMVTFARHSLVDQPDLLVASGSCNAISGIGDPFLPFRDVLSLLSGDVEQQLTAGAISHELARRLWGSLLVTCQAMLLYGPNLLGLLIAHADLVQRAQTAVPPSLTNLAQLRQLARRKETSTDLKQEFLFQQITNVLKFISERHPLLILLDDLQWADATSISLLFHLARRLRNDRIFIIGAYRPEEVALGRGGERHPLEKVLAELKREYGPIQIDLGQTDESESRHFIDAYLNSERNDLDDTFRQALFQQTGGHPLFTVELLRAMQERGDLVMGKNGRWTASEKLDWQQLPSRVEAVIEERISRLEDELREILTIASVDGEEFTAQVVARVQKVNERHLLRLLSKALVRKHRLVREQADIELGNTILSRYRFAHALFQKYLYDALSSGERRLLHAEVAGVLETLYGDDVDEIAVQLAHHYERAKNANKALQYLQKAGEQAARRFANDEAIAHFSRALALMPREDQETEFELRLAREKVYDLLGQREEQIKEIKRLNQLAVDLKDTKKKILVGLRKTGYEFYTGKFEAGIATVEKSIELAKVIRDKTLEGWSIFEAGRILMFVERRPEAQTHLSQALSIAQEQKLAKLLLECLNNLGVFSIMSNNFEQAKQYFMQVQNLTKNDPDAQLVRSKVLNNLGGISGIHGLYTAAIDYLRQSLVIKKSAGDIRGEAISLISLGDIYRFVGQYSLAKTCQEQALEISKKIDHRTGIFLIIGNLGILAYHAQDHQQADKLLRDSIRLFTEGSTGQVPTDSFIYLGHSLLAKGRLDEAAAQYQELIDIIQASRTAYFMIDPVAGLANVSFKRGVVDEALRQVEEVLSYLDERGFSGAVEPFNVYLTCYRILAAVEDERAPQVLAKTYQELQNKADLITDKRMRRSFLNNVAAHREIIKLYHQLVQN